MEMGFVPIKRQSLAELNVLKKNTPYKPFPKQAFDSTAMQMF